MATLDNFNDMDLPKYDLFRSENNEKVHAHRLILFLEGVSREEMNRACPGRDDFDLSSDRRKPGGWSSLQEIEGKDGTEYVSFCRLDGLIEMSMPPRQEICKACREFVGLHMDSGCPCRIFDDGCQEAVKRSWLALEEKGYI